MPFILLLLLVPIAVIAVMPLILIQRYRVGTARRMARPWAATVNLALMAFSAVFFLVSAAFTTIWVPGALTGALLGLPAGMLLGGLGLAMTRWEAAPHALHYTPNRLLVLIVTLLVTARVLYGFWRSWAVVQAGATNLTALGAFGIPESLGAAAIVIGYYLAYGVGLRWKIGRWQRRALRRA